MLFYQNINLFLIILCSDSHAAIVVYDITQKKSFESLQRWIDELKNKGPEKLGTKYLNYIMITLNYKTLIDKEKYYFK